MNNRAIKVLHVPCNTAYIKKIQKEKSFEIVNNTRINTLGDIIPQDVSFQWIVSHKNQLAFWDSFDICHIHYGFELEDFTQVSLAIKLMQKHQKAIVFTCHELRSVHQICNDEYKRILYSILSVADAVITLTQEASLQLREVYPELTPRVIPHGLVVEPSLDKKSSNKLPEILLFGTLRPNRDILTTFINAQIAFRNQCAVTWLTKPFTANQIERFGSLQLAIKLAAKDDLARIELALPLPDDELAERMKSADILALPYIWAGHSGLLELAFDCGLLPVITKAGFMESQYRLWPVSQKSSIDLINVNWSDGKDWLYQTRFVQGLNDALRALPRFRDNLDLKQRQEFRQSEYSRFLDAHLGIYLQALNQGKKKKIQE